MQRRGSNLPTTAMSLGKRIELTRRLWVPVGFAIEAVVGIVIPGDGKCGIKSILALRNNDKNNDTISALHFVVITRTPHRCENAASRTHVSL